LWQVSFPYLDKLDIIFGADRANGIVSETFEDVVDGQEKELVDHENDETSGDHEMEETESVNQSSQPFPCEPNTKKAKREKTPKAKGKKKMVVDLTSSVSNMSSNLSNFMSEMNTHLSTIASAMSTTQQHEQVLMAREEAIIAREQELENQKKNLINELLSIDGLTRFEAMLAAKKLASDSSNLSLFYESPDEEWKKEFVINMIHPNLPPRGSSDA